jgi:acetyl-CoA carboxylase carboxyl transferase subunit alpha
MLEHAIFTVASPEAAAAILWRDSGKAAEAAERMKITAQDLKRYGLVDDIVPEPTGGAHRDHAAAAAAVTAAIREALAALERLPLEDLLARRYRKYRDIAFYQ